MEGREGLGPWQVPLYPVGAYLFLPVFHFKFLTVLVGSLWTDVAGSTRWFPEALLSLMSSRMVAITKHHKATVGRWARRNCRLNHLAPCKRPSCHLPSSSFFPPLFPYLVCILPAFHL